MEIPLEQVEEFAPNQALATFTFLDAPFPRLAEDFLENDGSRNAGDRNPEDDQANNVLPVEVDHFCPV